MSTAKNTEYCRVWRERKKARGENPYKLRTEMTHEQLERIRERQRKTDQARRAGGYKKKRNREHENELCRKYRAEKKLRGGKNYTPRAEMTHEQVAAAKAREKKYYDAHPDRVKAKNTRYKARMKELGIKPVKSEEYKRKQREYNREKYHSGVGYEKAKKWREENRAKRRLHSQKWRDLHPESAREHARRSSQKRRNTPWGKINNSMRSIFTSYSKRGSGWGKYNNILGYSWQDLRLHIEAQFTEGMTWEHYVVGEIHIDHIKPLKLYRYESIYEPLFKEAWSLSNLRPLWKLDNLQKGSKYEAA